MVVELLGDERRARHEAERLVEILEHELPADGVAALDLAPAGELGERGLAGVAGQFLGHGREPLERANCATIAAGLPLAKAAPADLPIAGHTSSEAFMSWSLNIGTIAGTAVRVHITFLLFLGWIFVASYVVGRRGRGLDRAALHDAAVRLRGRARIRPHLHGARLRRGDARRDAAADRRRGAARAHPGGAVRGISGRDRRPAGQRRDRLRPGRACRRASQRRRSRRGRQREASRSSTGSRSSTCSSRCST